MADSGVNNDPLYNPGAGIHPSQSDEKTNTKPVKGVDWERERQREQDVENIWGRQKTPKGNR